jgi:multiple sugar transport system permease protein
MERVKMMNAFIVKKKWNYWCFGLFLGLTILIMLFPIVWMVMSSLKNQANISAYPPLFFFEPYLGNYRQVFAATDFFKNAVNSLVITFGSLAISLMVGLPAAYGIARFKQTKIAMMLLVVRMFPFITFLIPWFRMFQSIGLTDTYVALIASHMVIILPLIVWITMGFFEDIPVSYDEAAMIDGCSQFGIFFKIALPLARPGIIAASVLSCIFSWNNLMFALVLGGQNTKTLPVSIQNFMSFEEVQWGQLCAVATLITLPIIVIVLFLQKYLVKGLTGGGLKG